MAEIEKILKRRTKKVKNHCVVITFRAKPSDKWHTNASGESLVDLGFVLELRVLGFNRFELDGHLFPRNNVDAEVDVA